MDLNRNNAWGNDAAERATSRARVRARLAELLGAHGPPSARVVLAGFSQGAGVAADVAVEAPRIGALASLSACGFWLRGAFAGLPRSVRLDALLPGALAIDGDLQSLPDLEVLRADGEQRKLPEALVE